MNVEDPFEKLDRLTDESVLYVNEALSLEEKGCPDQAVTMYERALGLLDEALGIPSDVIEAEEDKARKREKARKCQIKLSRTRQQVVFRLREIRNDSVENFGKRPLQQKPPQQQQQQPPQQQQQQPPQQQQQQPPQQQQQPPEPPPPTYEEATNGASGNDDDDYTSLPSNALIIFTIPKEVQIFYIGADGSVSAPSYPSALYVFKFTDDSAVTTPTKDDKAPAFIQVGSWVYPLIPGKSPILQSSSGSYMFPDLDDSIEGNAVGLILPENVTDDERRGLEMILSELTSSGEDLSEYNEYIKFSAEVSSGLVKGAEFVGVGMVKGAIKASEWMHRGGDKLKEHIAPEPVPRNVDPKIQKSLEAAKWATEKGVKLSGYLVSKVGTATVALGRFLAPHIQRQSTRALCHFREQSEEKSKKQIDIVAQLASGSVTAVSTLYMGLENSSKILANNIANNTVKVVSHKYGADVGDVTNNALSAAGNTYLTMYNAGALSVKGIAKRTVKDAGKFTVNVPEEVIRGTANPLAALDDKKDQEEPK